MAGAQARYGISALDLGYKDYAQNDELMVHGDDGRIYYKRTDGTIVSYSDKDLTESQVVDKTMGVLLGIDGLTLPENEYIVYRTFDTTGKLDLVTSTDVAISRGATLSKNVPGFFFRIRGNDAVSSSAAIMKAVYANKVTDGSDAEVSVKINVSNNGANQQTMTINTHLDTLTYVKFPAFTGTLTNYIVTIASVSFPMFKAAYTAAGEAHKVTILKVNHGNEKFEVNCIDFIGYASSIAALADEVTDDVSIKSVTLSTEASKVYAKENSAVANAGGIPKTAFVISKDKPTSECVWGKIVEG